MDVKNGKLYEKCNNCKFYVSGGLCKRHPPQLILVGSKIECHYPFPGKSDWCGEYIENEIFGHNEKALTPNKDLAKSCDGCINDGLQTRSDGMCLHCSRNLILTDNYGE